MHSQAFQIIVTAQGSTPFAYWVTKQRRNETCKQQARASIYITVILLVMKFFNHNISCTYVIHNWAISLLESTVRRKTILSQNNFLHLHPHSRSFKKVSLVTSVTLISWTPSNFSNTILFSQKEYNVDHSNTNRPTFFDCYKFVLDISSSSTYD
jgi:hypothetical protein